MFLTPLECLVQKFQRLWNFKEYKIRTLYENSYLPVTKMVPGGSTRDCAGTSNILALRWAELSAVHVTAKAICERFVLVLVSKMAIGGEICFHALSTHIPTGHPAAVSRFPILFVQMEWLLKNMIYLEPVVMSQVWLPGSRDVCHGTPWCRGTLDVDFVNATRS